VGVVSKLGRRCGNVEPGVSQDTRSEQYQDRYSSADPGRGLTRVHRLCRRSVAAEGSWLSNDDSSVATLRTGLNPRHNF
jgi:hypothetical protein